MMKRDTAPLESIQPDAFLAQAGLWSVAQARLAKSAMLQTTTEELRVFAAQVAADQDKIIADLSAIAARKRLPNPPESEDDGQESVESPPRKSGADFDRAYLAKIGAGFDSATSVMRRGERIREPQISALASRALALLAAHSRKAESMLRAMKEQEAESVPSAVPRNAQTGSGVLRTS